MQSWKTLKHLSCASSLLQSSCRHRNVIVIKSATFFSRAKKIASTLTGADLEEIKSAGATDNAPPPTDNTALTVNRGPLPLITSRQLNYVHPSREPRQAWLENLDSVEEKKLGLIDLHPDVFGVFPRLDIISENIRWQRLFKTVNWAWTPSRGQIKATGRKPWPQKGTGRARHGDIKSPLWLDGAKAHGPKGPKSYYFMLPYYKRILGLTSTLSVKHAQDDLKIVDSLDIPTDDPKFLEELVEKRAWGLSVLFVDDSDIAPRNIALASDSIDHMNIMPLYGLNVLSMTKHETLVLTLAALNKLEEKLVMHINRHDPRPPTARKIYTGIY